MSHLCCDRRTLGNLPVVGLVGTVAPPCGCRVVSHKTELRTEAYARAGASGTEAIGATIASPKDLWRCPSETRPLEFRLPPPPLTTGSGFARDSSELLRYVAAAVTGSESIGNSQRKWTELWTGPTARIVGGPQSPEMGVKSRSRSEGGRTFVCHAEDGTNAGLLTIDRCCGSSRLGPGRTTITSAVAVSRHPTSRKVDGSVRVVRERYRSIAWPDALFVYSGPDVGTTFWCSVTARPRAYVTHAASHSRGRRLVSCLGADAWASARRDPTQGSLAHRPRDGAERKLTTSPRSG